MTLPPWHLHLDVWLALGSATAAYLIAVTRHARAEGRPVDGHRLRLFLGGMALLWVASDWPVHDLSERYLYSIHMVQHMVLTLLAAPLLVAGVPAWLYRSLLGPAPVADLFRFLTRPLMGIIVFNAVLLFVHWPSVVEASVSSELAHFALHVLVLGSALLMWWPIVSPLPELPPIAPPSQMLYLFVQSIAPTVPASFLTFGHTVLYPAYATFPRIWGVSALDDQMVAGLLMKLVGGLILWTVIAAVFFRWANRERADDDLAAARWHEEMRVELSR